MPSEPLSIEIALTPRFQKDLRDLVKRYRSIRKDLRILIEQLQSGDVPGDEVAGGDAPTPTEAVWCRHLSPVKDIKIFLRGTPKIFPLRHFIVRNATRPTLALKKKSKYLRTLNILLAGGFSPKAKFPTKPHIFSCLGAKLDPDCYSLIYQYSIMRKQACCSFSHALPCFWAQSLPVLQDRQSSTRLPFIPHQPKRYVVGIPVCLAKYQIFKVRLKNSDTRKGKSGGYRVIYYLKTSQAID